MNTEFGEKLQQLAEQLVDEAGASDDADFKLDCFKALTTFYVQKSKLGKKAEPEDDGAAVLPMEAMRNRVRAVANGGEQDG